MIANGRYASVGAWCDARRILLHLLNRKILLAALILLPIFWSSEWLMPTTAAHRDVIHIECSTRPTERRPDNLNWILCLNFVCLLVTHRTHIIRMYSLWQRNRVRRSAWRTHAHLRNTTNLRQNTKTHWKRAAKGRLLLGKKYFWFWKFSTKL